MAPHRFHPLPLRFAALACAGVTLAILAARAGAEPAAPSPAGPPPAGALAELSRDLFTDIEWPQSVIEIAEYSVTIKTPDNNFKDRAKLTIRKDFADPVTRARALDRNLPGLRPVLAWRLSCPVSRGGEDHGLTMLGYVGLSDLKSLKIDMALFDEDGLSFKQWVNHKGTLDWNQFGHEPGEGPDAGKLSPAPPDLTFVDALPVVLRGLRFEKPVDLKLPMLPSRATTLATRDSFVTMRVTSSGTAEEIEAGGVKQKAYRVDVTVAEPATKPADERERPMRPGHDNEPAFRPPLRFWFAADPKLNRVMLRCTSPSGLEMNLATVNREQR